MSPKRAKALAKSLIVDIDAAVAGDPRDEAARHSAGVSAAIIATRLIGGIAINIARIADALEDIADKDTEETDDGGS